MKHIILFLVLLLALFSTMPANAIMVGITLDVHQDVMAPPDQLPNDFHIEGKICSHSATTPTLVSHVDGPFVPPNGMFNYTITPAGTGNPGEYWYTVTADWSFPAGSPGLPFCQVYHFGLIFDVEGDNTMINVEGWWTRDGKRIGDVIRNLFNNGAVPVLGFDVKSETSSLGQSIRIGNGITNPALPPNHMPQPIENIKITQMDVISFPADTPISIDQLKLGGAQDTWAWRPVTNTNGVVISPGNPLYIAPDSFFDVFLETLQPEQPGVLPGQQFSIPADGFLVARTKMQFTNNAGITEEQWQWDFHQAPGTDLCKWQQSDEYKWLQMPDLMSTGVDVRMDDAGIDSQNPYPTRILADDFKCVETGPITDIHFWGSWLNDIKGNIEWIHVSLHSDIPANLPDVPWSKPGPVLWERNYYQGQFNETLFATLPLNQYEWWYDPFKSISIPNGDQNVWQYDICIPQQDWYIQKGTIKNPIIYWLDIQVHVRSSQPQPQFGWKTRDWRTENFGGGHFMDDAVFGLKDPSNINWVMDLHYPPGHPNSLKSMDMAFVITGQKRQRDWGDAPSPYPTLAVNNGASHGIIPGYCLGNLIDAEPDGQPNAIAIGDDLNNFADEDGVSFNSIYVGCKAKVKVVASAPGFLNAWMDFNGNGSWADMGEQIFTNQPLVAGANWLTYQVPNNAISGKAFARFRFNSTGGLTFTGNANDGEVEDYMVQIKPMPITVNKAVAKTLNPGTDVMIKRDIVTANFGSYGWYFEEPDRKLGEIAQLGRFAGIGVKVEPEDPAPWIPGDMVTCVGTTVLDGCELMVKEACSWKDGYDTPLKPLAQNNISSGGAMFGSQPGLTDVVVSGVCPKSAYGTNSVGLLVRIFGICTYVESDATGNPVNAWFNDGSNLWDGTYRPDQMPALGVKVHFPTTLAIAIAEGKYYAASGIMRTFLTNTNECARCLWATEIAQMNQ